MVAGIGLLAAVIGYVGLQLSAPTAPKAVGLVGFGVSDKVTFEPTGQVLMLMLKYCPLGNPYCPQEPVEPLKFDPLYPRTVNIPVEVLYV